VRRIALLGCIATTASIAVVPTASAEPRTDPPTWADEFDGTSLDGVRWSHRATGQRWDGTLTPDAVSVGGGMLTIKAYTEAGKHYSGMISTQRHDETVGLEQTYGQFEARLRFNGSPGQWSAFWLQSPTMGATIGDPGRSGVEIDIAEHRVRCTTAPAELPTQTCGPDSDVADRIQQAVLWDGYGADAKVAVALSKRLSGLGNGSWHRWALRWTPTDVTFLYDDAPVWSRTGPISRRSEYIVLSSEVGEFFAGPIPAGGYRTRATSTTNMQVDYVRVWQTTPPTSTRAPTAAGTPDVGSALTCSPGAWSGQPAPAFAYEWLVDGVPVAGASTPAYVLQRADATRAVSCRVTASKGAGAASAVSNVLTVGAAPPLPPEPPPPAAPVLATFASSPVGPLTPPPPPPDTTAPRATLSGSRHQRLAPTVAVVVACPEEACTARTTAVVRVPRIRGARARAYTPTARTASVARDARVAVRLRLSRAIRRAIARALRAHARSVARLRVRVADAAGNARTLTREITFRR
jgi:beta-glucanase (GH16 family)